jgi:predicted RNA-binding protein with RPS1 domain
MSKQLTITKKMPKGWEQISDHCFMDKDGNAHFRIKSSYKLTKTKVKNPIELSKKIRKVSLKAARENPEKNYSRSKKWKESNPKKYKKYMKKLNDSSKECKRLVMKINYKKNHVYKDAVRKKLMDKRKKLGILSRCAASRHGTCKNILKKCTCKCHK